MQFLPPTRADWQQFRRWAAAENWTIPAQELRLFQNLWRHWFFALHAGGAVKGFVSAVPYAESGWIGNLLVGPEQRGQGYGALLFDFALALLHQAGLQRVWLTASETGLPIYARRGFVAIDRVERWCGEGLGELDWSREMAVPELIALDGDCWGEDRARLLNLLAKKAEVCRAETGMALLQPSRPAWLLGPWLAPRQTARQNRSILQQALGKTPAGTSLLIDVLVSAGMASSLRNAGFDRLGANVLMCLSAQPPALHGVVSLASPGSLG